MAIFFLEVGEGDIIQPTTPSLSESLGLQYKPVKFISVEVLFTFL